MVFSTFACSIESPSRFTFRLFWASFGSFFVPWPLLWASRGSVFGSLTSPWTLQGRSRACRGPPEALFSVIWQLLGRSRDALEPALGVPRLSFRFSCAPEPLSHSKRSKKQSKRHSVRTKRWKKRSKSRSFWTNLSTKRSVRRNVLFLLSLD